MVNSVMVNVAESTNFKVGDRVRLTQGTMRGHAGRIVAINQDDTYCLIGDWTKITGFTRVHYGPLQADQLEKI